MNFSTTSNKYRKVRRFFTAILPAVLVVSLLASLTGCTRRHYRQQADREVYSLVRSVACEVPDLLSDMTDYTISVSPTSRMFDPHDPDKEPMSVDDPRSHRYMHCVDCKKLRKCKRCRQTPWADNPFWRQYLNIDAEGNLFLDKETALDLALQHSPEYQSAKENIYLGALAVSEKRFAFDVQFYGEDSLFYNTAGDLVNPVYDMQNEAGLGFEKMFATGGTVGVDFLNSVSWDLCSSDVSATESLITMKIVQPLLRGAGKKIVLEDLTQAERNLLANMRQMAFYRQGFYVNVLTGGGVPAPSGSGTSGVAAPKIGGIEAGNVSGYYNLLIQQTRIANQMQNVVGIESNLRRVEELFRGGRQEKLSVELLRSSLYSSQSELLGLKSDYLHAVENYLATTLGLAPDLPVTVRDPMLDQFQFVSTNLVELQAESTEILMKLRELEERLPVPEGQVFALGEALKRLGKEIQIIDHDFAALEQQAPERKSSLTQLGGQVRKAQESTESSIPQVDPQLFDVETFEEDVADVHEQIREAHGKYEAVMVLFRFIETIDRTELLNLARAKRLPEEVVGAIAFLNEPELLDVERRSQKTVPEEVLDVVRRRAEETGQHHEASSSLPPEEIYFHYWFGKLVELFSRQTTDASFCQGLARVHCVGLKPISVDAVRAFEIAEENRLDWMNARAALVDAWRKVEVAANKLKADLDVEINGSAGTIDEDGLKFDASNSSLNVGLRWKSPLNRHAERNTYRTALLNYQSARRTYYRYVDNVNVEIRNILRTIERNQIEFEILRAEYQVATIQVYLAQNKLVRPVRSDDMRNYNYDTNVTKDIIDALASQVRSQNAFLSKWMQYETLRMGLDLHLGTMQLDERGRWIDPGPMTTESLERFSSGGAGISRNDSVPSKMRTRLNGSGSVEPVPDVRQPTLAPTRKGLLPDAADARLEGFMEILNAPDHVDTDHGGTDRLLPEQPEVLEIHLPLELPDVGIPQMPVPEKALPEMNVPETPLPETLPEKAGPGKSGNAAVETEEDVSDAQGPENPADQTLKPGYDRPKKHRAGDRLLQGLQERNRDSCPGGQEAPWPITGSRRPLTLEDAPPPPGIDRG